MHASSRPIPARRMFGDTDLARMDAQEDRYYAPRYVGVCRECGNTGHNCPSCGFEDDIEQQEQEKS